eukprot:SM000373S13616  [mRNA]  locus=s373:38575:42158:- [translate_table: standard]
MDGAPAKDRSFCLFWVRSSRTPSKLQLERTAVHPPVHGVDDDKAAGPASKVGDGGDVGAALHFEDRGHDGAASAAVEEHAAGVVRGSPEEHLEVLRDRRGLWHEYAPLIPALNRAGYTSPAIEEATGLTGVEQNAIVVALQVYNSLKSSGLEPDKLAEFDNSGAELLYELRVLSAEGRRSAAEYAIEAGLDAKGCREVARCMKDYERRGREEGRSFFSAAPGDALAFAYYRQQKEARGEGAQKATLEKALSFAVSEKARKKLRQALGTEEVGEDDIPEVEAMLQVIRLAGDESAACALPVVGTLEEVDQAALEAAPTVDLFDESNPFRIFASSPGHRWVAVPAWPALTSAPATVALEVEDVGGLPSISGKGLGPGLVLVDRANQELDGLSFFVVATTDGDGKLALKSGGQAAKEGNSCLGKVIMVLRPPSAEEAEKEWE